MKRIKKSMAAVALSLAMGLTTIGIPGEPVMEVHAEVTPDSSISLSDVSTVTADTAGSVLRIYGDGSTVYDVPISVTANCTVLLDNISNTADLTVETGVTANIVIRGNCSLGNIVAVGGVRTSVTISGEDGGGTLTTGNIAQAKAGQALASGYPGDQEMGANVKIEDCTVICDNVGCGSDGLGWTYDQYQNGNERSYVSNAGSASDTVTIRNATLNARGSIACGGNGVVKTGSDRCVASDGGRAGNVTIANSHVTVGGNIALGGQGGDGCVTGIYNTVTAGEAMYPGIVTIVNNSVVDVYGNVATASDLADESHLSDRDGLSGGTVIVDKSSLTCKDIASGGCGVGKVYYRESSTNTTYYGTDGGQGGVLIAKKAVINCETACNGGEAGEYFDQTVGEEASYTGHPRDGSGGRIDATNSQIAITDSACKRAMKWDGYDGNRSYHNRPSFVGGLLMGGKVYGADIITDVTAIDDCELIADYGVVNSEGSNTSKCIIHTSDEMAGESVFVTANTVSGSAILNESGQLVTYLAMDTNDVKICGTKTYVGTLLVTRDPIFNEFSLEEESIPETPDDGDEEIPGTGGEEIPGTGGEEIPGTGGEETPGTGGEETPGTGGEEMPGIGGEETPGTGSEETPPVTEHEIVIPTSVTGSAVTVLVGEQTLNLESDENGNIKFTIAPDVTEFFVITEPVKYRYSVTDGVPGDPSIVGPTAVLSGNGVLTAGDPLRLTVEAVASLETNTLSYKWYKDGTTLEVTGSALVISQAALSDAGSYFVVVTESNGQSVTTASIGVSVDAVSGTGGSSGEAGDSSGETAGGGSGNTSEEGTGGSGEDNSGEGSGSTSGDSSGENSGESTGSETGGNTGESSGGSSGSTSSGGSAGGSSGGSSGSASGGSSGGFGGGSTGGTSGGSSGGSGGGSAGGASGGSAGGSSGGSAGGASGGASSQTPTDQSTSDTSEKTEDPAGQVTSIQMKSNLNGIKLLPTSEKNTYKKYFSKTVKLTVSKEPGCTYYYKVVEKGKANSTVKWKKLTGNVIKVAASDIAKRIYIRAVNENGTSVTRKTTGFYVDNRKPVVKGVTNKAVYTKPVKIRFSDNISVKAATLNGKKVKNGCTVSKKGIYRLIVTDRAGNKKIIRFTIKE